MKTASVIPSLFIVLASAVLMHAFDRSSSGFLKGLQLTNITGYPAAYGNEPFVFFCIRDRENPSKNFYVFPCDQKKIRALKYGLYSFTAFVLDRKKTSALTNEKWFNDRMTNFDGLIVPVRWKPGK